MPLVRKPEHGHCMTRAFEREQSQASTLARVETLEAEVEAAREAHRAETAVLSAELSSTQAVGLAPHWPFLTFLCLSSPLDAPESCPRVALQQVGLDLGVGWRV